jgi:F-type H+-transporting ATPase subunit delta
MKENNISKAYANAILQLAKESNIEIVKEFTTFTELINSSTDLENLLFLDVFTSDEREDVLKAVFEKIQFSKLFTSFVLFLLNENRLSMFPLIFKDIIVIDDYEKGFIRGTIEGSDDQADQPSVDKIISYLKEKLGITPELSYVKNNNISAGYKVTVQDYQIDATLDGQLSELSKNIISK